MHVKVAAAEDSAPRQKMGGKLTGDRLGGVFLAVFAFNFLGDALRDALDPRLRGLG